MATTHAVVSVGTAATRLSAPAGAGPDYASPGQTVVVQAPAGAQAVFLGSAAVTAVAFGHQLAAGDVRIFELGADDELWAIVAATTQAVNVLRFRV